MSAHLPMGQIVRFCVVGACCYVVTLGVLTGLCEFLGFHYIAAFVVAFLLGNVFGYLLNGRYTFARRDGLENSSLLRYVTINCVLLVLNSVSLGVLVETFNIWYVWATVILSIVNIPVSFIAHRTLSYKIGRNTFSG